MNPPSSAHPVPAIAAERLAELVGIALERTAFIFSDPAPLDPADVKVATHAAVIRYRGASSGTIVVRAGEGFLRTLAAGLLGLEPAEVVLDDHADDALKELANIVGGSVIDELGGRTRTFHLGLPESTQPAQVLASPPDTVQCCLRCEGAPVFIAWSPSPVAALAA